jgi:hypothetical protein
MKKRQWWSLILGIVLVVALVGAGSAMVLGRRSGTGNTGPGLNGAGYGGMMTGETPFGGMMGGGANGMMPGIGGGTATGRGLTLDQARQAVQATLDARGNPDLAIDEVMEFQDNFYALIKERSTGHGAFELLVTKTSGSVVPEYGPNMMWNTKYGMMGWQRDSQPMTVSAEQAATRATAWLAQNQSGIVAETPDEFYGYYTVHTTKNGTINGMLSVNGYTGQIWYHPWHGAFIGMQQINP